jgi:hypothetical protein
MGYPLVVSPITSRFQLLLQFKTMEVFWCIQFYKDHLPLKFSYLLLIKLLQLLQKTMSRLQEMKEQVIAALLIKFRRVLSQKGSL